MNKLKPGLDKLSSLAAYLFFVSLYAFLLSLVYHQSISSAFEYAGFHFDVNGEKVGEAGAAILLLTVVIPHNLCKPSDFYLSLLHLIVYIPFALLYALSNEANSAFYYVSGSVLSIYCLCAYLPRPRALPLIKVKRFFLLSFASLGLASVYLLQALLAGRFYFNFSLLDVYSYRDESNSLASFGLLSYLSIWASKVVLPSLVVFSACFRRFFLVAAFCLGSILLFGISQQKAVLFYPYLALMPLFLFRRLKELWLLPFFLLLLVGSFALFSALSGDIVWLSLFVRRTLFLPAYLTFRYYEFFSSHEFVWWSSSFMQFLLDYPYDLPPSQLIGRFLGGNANANNTFLATGYMHAGVFGLAAYSVIVAFLLRAIDQLTARRVSVETSIALTIAPFTALFASADLPTALFTHGLFLSFLVLMMAPSILSGGRSVREF